MIPLILAILSGPVFICDEHPSPPGLCERICDYDEAIIVNRDLIIICSESVFSDGFEGGHE